MKNKFNCFYIFIWLFLIVFNLTPQICSAQFSKGFFASKKRSKIEADIYFLADDNLEGRRTGTEGETKAAQYIEKRMQECLLTPFEGKYIHPFNIDKTDVISDSSFVKIGKTKLLKDKEILFAPFGANGKGVGSAIPGFYEANNVHLIKFSEVGAELNNPHGDGLQKIYDRAKKAKEQNADAVFFINDENDKADFDQSGLKTNLDNLEIPIFIIQYAGFSKHILSKKMGDWIDLSYLVLKTNKSRQGKNVVGYWSNGAKKSIVIGAHYDHLGYGEDHNSLYAGKTKEIHNGADDNASGVAALLAVAGAMRAYGLKNYNYIFIAFSGEELGLFGSKKFLEKFNLDSSKIDCMINMDMVGRLNDDKEITIGGVGTSPDWFDMLLQVEKTYKVKYDSSGMGPSDHTSFYLKNIPVLFFFTGTHSDYHKPTDDADKINFYGVELIAKSVGQILIELDNSPVLRFTKTADKQPGDKVSFKVTLGIMPDYTFSGKGVRVDGVSDGKPAAIAGIKADDIIIRMGDYDINDIYAYMKELGKYKKGDVISIMIMRNNEKKNLLITF